MIYVICMINMIGLMKMVSHLHQSEKNTQINFMNP